MEPCLDIHVRRAEQYPNSHLDLVTIAVTGVNRRICHGDSPEPLSHGDILFHWLDGILKKRETDEELNTLKLSPISHPRRAFEAEHGSPHGFMFPYSYFVENVALAYKPEDLAKFIGAHTNPDDLQAEMFVKRVARMDEEHRYIFRDKTSGIHYKYRDDYGTWSASRMLPHAFFQYGAINFPGEIIHTPSRIRSRTTYSGETMRIDGHAGKYAKDWKIREDWVEKRIKLGPPIVDWHHKKWEATMILDRFPVANSGDGRFIFLDRHSHGGTRLEYKMLSRPFMYEYRGTFGEDINEVFLAEYGNQQWEGEPLSKSDEVVNA